MGIIRFIVDFVSFNKAFDIINSKEHLTEEGLRELTNISNSMYTYRKFSFSTYYSPVHVKENSKVIFL